MLIFYNILFFIDPSKFISKILVIQELFDRILLKPNLEMMQRKSYLLHFYALLKSNVYAFSLIDEKMAMCLSLVYLITSTIQNIKRLYLTDIASLSPIHH
jgi:hypothetical protein